MSTENEEWRENSYNEENTGAGRDGNKSYNLSLIHILRSTSTGSV